MNTPFPPPARRTSQASAGNTGGGPATEPPPVFREPMSTPLHAGVSFAVAAGWIAAVCYGAWVIETMRGLPQ